MTPSLYTVYALAGASIGCFVAMVVTLINWRFAMTFSDKLIAVINKDRELIAAANADRDEALANAPTPEAVKAVEDRFIEQGQTEPTP